ncbi:OR5V1 protein, partial [Picathartes gymnocephalus]|nr:OR5V1 protein [Picathartes gymnocephalus]
MAAMNQTQATEFVLLGFSHGQPFLFALFLAIYLLALLGNSAILSPVSLDPHLHSRTYLFLSHLSCLDLCYSSAKVPKILANALRPQAAISYGGCLARLFLLLWCVGLESPALGPAPMPWLPRALCPPAVMACARVPAPALLPGRCLWGLLGSAAHTLLAARLSLCGAARLQHIFCDVPPLLGAACSSTRPSEAALRVASISVGFSPFLLILISYLCVLTAILSVPRAAGRRKAFSSCFAHALVVTLYSVTAKLNYNRPISGYCPAAGAAVSVLYCIITPSLSPLIYSLRNQAVPGALREAV